MNAILLGGLTALFAAAPVALAEGDGFAAPGIESSGLPVPICVAIVAVLAIAAVAFKNAKRTHLD